ncbi:Anthranilate 1,2-dioxygenase large subunit [Roseibaca ekhonensis]|uniref:Anthranilate 1,2-dioxygenase large subunit n=1 Tax=Roseinatronobacter ekhonensis TaxID=254356 RepID=A0A3B0MB04_9RHOB|nr:aromatic ring-hydroxylating dioxygenase subunit alpha [Roseibaca ekhonensis]SUZ32853.1 Anthranilate 1,2-dioxygenase large subunit [Roseibaca ekhonensis]
MPRDSDMLAQLMRRKPAHSLPRALYTDPDMYEVDLDRLWYTEWLFAIPGCEIPKTGNHITVQVGAYSVIIVRGTDGVIRAFHNSCRHRGSRICKAAKGSAPKLVCPYHQWTYELDGRLLWARDMGPEFDPAQHGLKPVHCRDAAGMVFICLAEVAPPFDALAEAATRYYGPHKLDACKVAYESTITEAANWKLVMENNRECYHCSGSHPALCVSFDDNPNIAGNGDGRNDPAIEAHLAKCEAAGLPSRFYIDDDSQWRFVRVPLLGKSVSYTMNGKQAVNRMVGDITLRDAGTLLFFHYPNTWNHFLADTVLLFRMLPLGPKETQVTTKWLVHKDAVEGVDYDLPRLTEVWTLTNDEDRAIVEQNQLGIDSPAYVPGPYSQIQESGVIQFVDWYANRMAERLTGRRLHAAE